MKKIMFSVLALITLSIASNADNIDYLPMSFPYDNEIELPYDIYVNSGETLPQGSMIVFCPGDGINCIGEFWPATWGTVKYNEYKAKGQQDIIVVRSPY